MTESRTPGAFVALAGDVASIRPTVASLGPGRVGLVEHDRGTWLTSPYLANALTLQEVLRSAEILIDVLLGVAALSAGVLDEEPRRIMPNRAVDLVGEDGSLSAFRHATERIGVRDEVMAVGGKPVPRSPEEPLDALAYRLALLDERVAEALAYVHEGSWTSVAKVFEAIDEDLHASGRTLDEVAWADEKIIDAISHTANTEPRRGRHAQTPKHAPPAKPVALGEARRYACSVVGAWLREKGAV